MKKRGKFGLGLVGILLLFISFSFYFVSVSGNNNWVIEGNKVYVDNNDVYISAQPHTIKERGYVYFNITSKQHEGNVDIVFGFNTPLLKPTKAELYKPEWKNRTESYTCLEYFNYTLNPKHAWCYRNKTNENNETIEELELIYEHEFEWGNLNEKTIYWKVSYLQEWKDISQTFSSINYEHGGMNKWYYVKDIPIEKNKNYLIRGFIEIPRGKGFSPINLDEKYWFAIKPSSETLQNAITNNHLYALDPWINSSGTNQNKDYLTNGLEVYFSFEENAGTGVVYDSLGHVNITSLGTHNTQGVTGKIGKGFAVDGAGATYPNDQGQLNFHQDVTLSNNHTISFWVYLNEKNTSKIGWFQAWMHTSYDHDYIIDLHGRYGVAGEIATADWNWGSSGQSITIGGWHNVVIWTNDSILRVYLDGVWNGVNLSSASGYWSNAGLINKSAIRQYWLSNTLNGTFDEIGVWNRPLNNTEIADLYNNGAGITYSPLLDTAPPETTIPIITPTQPKTTDSLQCNATLTDNMQISLIANWTWYKNNMSYLSGIKTNIQNGTPTIIITLEAGNTSKGEQWKCEVLPYDGYNYGEPKNSTSATILNSKPNHSQPLLTTQSGKNFSYENITCYNQSTSDADNDNVINIYNWYKNNQPLAILNIPFENSVKDYSGNNNDGAINGASFTDGKVGRALSFDGVDDYVNIGKMQDLESNLNSSFSVSVWIKTANTTTNRRLMGSVDNGSTQAFTIAWNYGSTAQVNNLRIYLRDDEGNDYYSYLSSPNSKLTDGTWHHYVFGRNDNTELFVYIDGEKQVLTSNGILSAVNAFIGTGFQHPFVLGAQNDRGNITSHFNGIIDEVTIYPYALTLEQVKQRYEETKEGLTSSSTIVSQETTAGDKYMCQVTPNDGEEDGTTLNSTSLEVLWSIEFEVRDSYSNVSLNGVSINCNYSGFDQAGDTTNPYGPYGFPPGNWECTFEEAFHFTKTITFIADDDKTLPVSMSESGKLSIEEHTWLEWLYNCFKDGECRALLENINKTTTQIWQRLTGTDRSVITQEKVLSYELSSNSNISINYTVKVPYKEGVPVNELLPIRLYFWFTDTARTKCYSQDKATDTNKAEQPYCLPLVAETLGPNNGTVTFTVDLRPALATGTYNFTRSIEIDPLGVWTQYGREDLGSIEVLEDNNKIDINLIETAKSFFRKTGITGAAIGSNILSKDNLMFLIVLLNTFILIYFLVSSKIKKK